MPDWLKQIDQTVLAIVALAAIAVLGDRHVLDAATVAALIGSIVAFVVGGKVGKP
jgi:hypothetical protein